MAVLRVLHPTEPPPYLKFDTFMNRRKRTKDRLPYMFHDLPVFTYANLVDDSALNIQRTTPVAFKFDDFLGRRGHLSYNKIDFDGTGARKKKKKGKKTVGVPKAAATTAAAAAAASSSTTTTTTASKPAAAKRKKRSAIVESSSSSAGSHDNEDSDDSSYSSDEYHARAATSPTTTTTRSSRGGGGSNVARCMVCKEERHGRGDSRAWTKCNECSNFIHKECRAEFGGGDLKKCLDCADDCD